MKYLSKFLLNIASAIFVFVVLLACWSVVRRYVFNNSIVWAEEIIRYSFIWLIFLALPEATRTGAHVALDIVSGHVHGRFKIILEIAIELICAAFDIVIIYYGIKIARINMAQATPSLRFPYGYVYAALPVGAFFMLLFSLRRIWLTVRKKGEC